MTEFAANTFQSAKVWCHEINDAEEAATVANLQEIAPSILPKIVSKVTKREIMDRDKVMTVAWAAGLYLQANSPESMAQLDNDDWIVDSYPRDISARYNENLSSISQEAHDYLQAEFAESFSSNDSAQAADLFCKIIAYYEAATVVHDEYLGALEAV